MVSALLRNDSPLRPAVTAFISATICNGFPIGKEFPDASVDQATGAILKSARTGKIGDGKIFVTSIEQAIRIRTEEKNELAI